MSIAEIGRLWPEYEANARLIAAAPDLLEVARLAVINGRHAVICEFEISAETKPCDCYMVKLRAAIAKAEGKEAA